MKPSVIFLHGLESGPHGSKYQALGAAGWTVTAPDCEGVADVQDRVKSALEALEAAKGPVVIVGSSFGGLAAVLLYCEVAGTPLAEKVVGCVLCAPALHRGEADAIPGMHTNTLILHGREDDIVPLSSSLVFAGKHDLSVIETDDGHRLLRCVEAVAC